MGSHWYIAIYNNHQVFFNEEKPVDLKPVIAQLKYISK